MFGAYGLGGFKDLGFNRVSLNMFVAPVLSLRSLCSCSCFCVLYSVSLSLSLLLFVGLVKGRELSAQSLWG